MSSPILHIGEKEILYAYSRIQKALPDFAIAYAIKANPHPRILNLLNKEKSYFEVASLKEIEILLEIGISPQRILYSNPIKPTSSIFFAYEKGIRYFTIDSIEELEKFRPLLPEVLLFVRIQVPNEGSLWPLGRKFGLEKEKWDYFLSTLLLQEIPLYGVSFHVGSQCERLESWKKAMGEVEEFLSLAYQYALYPKALNIGGGFPVYLGRKIPSVEEIGEVIFSYIEKWRKKGIFLEKYFAEPGRYIVAEAGILETEVIGVIKRNQETWVYINAGVFHGLMESIEKIHYPVYFPSSSKEKKEEILLAGPTCDSLDTLYKVHLPTPKIGDKIYFLSTGAYTYVYSSFFNGFSPPHILIRKSLEEFTFYEELTKTLA